jgi:predicted transposase YdaD
VIDSVYGDLSTPDPYERLYLWNQPSADSVWFDDVEVTASPAGGF